MLAAVPGIMGKLGSIEGNIWKQDEMRKVCLVSEKGVFGLWAGI